MHNDDHKRRVSALKETLDIIDKMFAPVQRARHKPRLRLVASNDNKPEPPEAA